MSPLDICGDRNSVAAHNYIRSNKEAVCEQIVDLVRTRGDRGVTADEIGSEWGCSPNHVAPRLTELVAAGRLVRTDRRRKTRAGCLASVLVMPGQPQRGPEVLPSPGPISLFGDLARESRYPD